MTPRSTAVFAGDPAEPRHEGIEEKERGPHLSSPFRHEWLCLALLLSIVTLTWCSHYNRWTAESWATPPLLVADQAWPRWKMAFHGDALWGMAATKAMAQGEIGFFSKRPSSFGAPFTANWNDWLTTEEGLAAWWALLVRLFGLFRGSNLVLLSAHLLAATSFYLVCRYLRYDRTIALAGAALFALSHFSFWRGLPHLGLVMYWHIPLGFLVLWWCVRGERIVEERGKLLFSLGAGALHGIQSPYYAAMFLQLLFAGTACAVVRSREWKKALPAILITFVLVATFACMNVDTLYYRILHGPNPGVVERSYVDVEVWALKPVELFLPASHSIAAFERWANTAYYKRTVLLGEGGSLYLGIIGMFSLGWLLRHVLKGFARQDFQQIPLHFWCAAWVLGYSVVGGLTGIVGLWDIFFLRATNRYSIFILAAVLLFLVKQLTLQTRRWRTGSVSGLAVLLLAVGIYDQVPPRRPEQEKATRKMMKADQQLVAEIQSKLPEGAMIFQLPVMEFPESAPIQKMTEYEPFRPYLHSEHLRFSYGENKGRDRDRWQREAGQLSAADLVRTLEQYGFSAILLDRKGYSNPNAAQENLRAGGGGRVLARSRDHLCIELNPVRHPSFPPG